MTTRFTRFIW